MSVLIALCWKEGAFVAADSRRTTIDVNGAQSYVDTAVKVTRLAETTFIASAGHGDLGEIIRDRVKTAVGLVQDVSASDLADLVRRMAGAIQDKFAEAQRDTNVSTRLFVGGYDQGNDTGFLWDLCSTEGFKPVEVPFCNMTFSGPDAERLRTQTNLWIVAHGGLKFEWSALNQMARDIIRAESIDSRWVGGPVLCALAGPSGLIIESFEP